MTFQNNSTVGFTLQNLICEKYDIVPLSKHAIAFFEKCYRSNLERDLKPLVEKIFNEIGSVPKDCTTLLKNNDGELCLYNFILMNGSTLSIRTNQSGSKVAPREVGQAGFKKLNQHFGHIYGKQIKTQDDIKQLITQKIDKILPIFIENLFDADYIVWVWYEDSKFKHLLIDGNSIANFDYDYSNFSFTRTGVNWIESTTLKYKNISIAEIQVHKNRTFKFRFLMKNLINFISENKFTNETIGITAEKTVCDLYRLKYPKNFFRRFSKNIQESLINIFKNVFEIIPEPIKYCGNEKGIRGMQSKSPIDFILSNGKTLSLKTNVTSKICPSEVGQPNDKTCYLYFGHLTKENHVDKSIFKQIVYEHITEMLKIYIKHLFDCDYLVRIYSKSSTLKEKAKDFNYEIFKKDFGHNFIWKREYISFSKEKIEDWNESNTVYYLKEPIGEFQVHSHRNCFKFRFDIDKLHKIIKN